MHQQKQTPRKRYPSDLTDDEWNIIGELIPDPVWAENMQEPKHSSREMLDAIRYRTRTGSAWRLLPHDFPPWSTVQKRYYQWRDAGVFSLVNAALRDAVRLMEGRRVEPSAAMLDSQSVKSTDVGGPKGFDAGKKGEGSQAPPAR